MSKSTDNGQAKRFVFNDPNDFFIRMSIQANGMDALWPLSETDKQLSEWLDFSRLEQDYQTLMNSTKDVRPLRRLQSVQTLAYRLLMSTNSQH